MVIILFLCISTAITFENNKNYYDVLEINVREKWSLTDREIKDQFRKLSLTHHPDKYHSDKLGESEKNQKNEAYIEITEAYENLKTENLRRRYNEELGNKILENQNLIFAKMKYFVFVICFLLCVIGFTLFFCELQDEKVYIEKVLNNENRSGFRERKIF